MLNVHWIYIFYSIYKQKNTFVLRVRKCNFACAFMYAAWVEHIPWLAGRPTDRPSIKFTKYNYAFKHEFPHTHADGFIGLTNWMQTIYENAHRICSFFWGCGVEFFRTLGEFYPCKIDSLIVHSYSYIHTQCINMHHPFDFFVRQKRWVKMHNNVFIEIQCKLIPFIRTLNLLWGRSISAEKRSNQSECEKETLVSSLDELFWQCFFFAWKRLAFWFHGCILV